MSVTRGRFQDALTDPENSAEEREGVWGALNLQGKKKDAAEDHFSSPKPKSPPKEHTDAIDGDKDGRITKREVINHLKGKGLLRRPRRDEGNGNAGGGNGNADGGNGNAGGGNGNAGGGNGNAGGGNGNPHAGH